MRTKAASETVRKAKPLLVTDLRDLIEKLKPEVPIEARDAALLSLGWAGALRRSELVGLDWQQLGAGSGFVVLDERGIVITLMRSKASQDAAEQIVIPKADMPAACRALEAWANVVGLAPGQALFRPINQHDHIGADRLTDRSVSRIVKVRMRRLEHKRRPTWTRRRPWTLQRPQLAGGLCDQRGGQRYPELSHPAAYTTQKR